MATARRVSIKTPDQLDLRAIQQAIDNIRERITGAESLADTLTLTVGAKGASGATDITDLRRQIQTLAAQINALQLKLDALSGGGEEIMADAAIARVIELTKRVDEPDIEIDAGARAMIQALERRIESLEQGINP